jgi:predicted nucleic acid-binding protein
MMAAYVFDTSAVVKRYVQETGSSWVRSIADPAASHLIYLARITDVELTSAIVRRQRGGNLSAPDASAILTQFRQDLVQGYRIIEVTPALLLVARSLAEKHGLRAYDAVQLASAVELNAKRVAAGLATITLVSADQELNSSATAEGLPVEDPTLHP